MFGRRALIAALVLLAGGIVTKAGSERPAARTLSPAGLAKVSDYIRNEVATGKIPGAILLLQQHGKPVYYQDFGVRDVATELSMSADTIFRLYSMSKPVTSVMAMMLVEEGRLSLDDPVSQYIPAFAGMKVGIEKKAEDGKVALLLEPLERPIAIKDLLRHTSGLPYGYYGGGMVRELYADANLFNSNLTNAEFAAKIATLPLVEQPGTVWDYGYSTDVLGRVVEIIAGKTLLQFEKERLLDPLGMTETAFFVADPARFPRIAEPMPEDRNINPTTQVRDIRRPGTWESGGGGMVGTVGDYARFAQMLLNGGTYVAPWNNVAARRISLGRRRRHVLLHRSRGRSVRDLHGADSDAARPDSTGAEDADLPGDGAVITLRARSRGYIRSSPRPGSH